LASLLDSAVEWGIAGVSSCTRACLGFLGTASALTLTTSAVVSKRQTAAEDDSVWVKSDEIGTIALYAKLSF